MKINLPFNFGIDHMTFMRRAGYGAIQDYNTGITSYAKRFGPDHYPRFHVYIELNKDNRYSINLHLDQKKPSYEGSRAHSADYDGPVVEKEGARLQGLVNNQMNNQNQIKNVPEDKGFFAKIFGR